MFKFHEGAIVVVAHTHAELGLAAGDTGKVLALYSTNPAAYEITFRTMDGKEYDALMYEDELVEPGREIQGQAEEKRAAV